MIVTHQASAHLASDAPTEPGRAGWVLGMKNKNAPLQGVAPSDEEPPASR